ncbi:MAG: ketohydroxyglutarate aldolase [Acidimicrobiia bacterium]|nr:ketohydroxyglutarate aldolase [Acidimicrobiia bacterium]
MTAVTITVDDDHANAVAEVARAVGAAGAEVTAVLDTIGVVSATCDRALVEHLRRLPGVLAVEVEATDYRPR